MKDLSQYPVTFGYGATDGVYYYTPTPGKPKGPLWVGNYHRGDDRACPVGTPIIVNGTTIGLSGNTGASSGPHCHIGKFIGGSDVNPSHLGFLLESPKVFDTGFDSTNGNFVRLEDAYGVIWVYLHLSEIKVSKGQILTGAVMIEPATVRSLSADFDVPLTDAQVDYYSKHPGGYTELYQDFLKYNHDIRKQLEVTADGDFTPYSGSPLFTKT